MLKGFLNNIGENNMKIVEFGDGKYGVMKFHLFTNDEFLDSDIEYIKKKSNPLWEEDDMIHKHCKFDTIDDAKKARDVYLEKVKQEKLEKSYKIIE